MARQAAVVEIRARPFAPVIEEADVVVLLFKRLDRRGDEAVQLGEIRDKIGGQGKIQGETPDVIVFTVAVAIKVASL